MSSDSAAIYIRSQLRGRVDSSCVYCQIQPTPATRKPITSLSQECEQDRTVTFWDGTSVVDYLYGVLYYVVEPCQLIS